MAYATPAHDDGGVGELESGDAPLPAEVEKLLLGAGDGATWLLEQQDAMQKRSKLWSMSERRMEQLPPPGWCI